MHQHEHTHHPTDASSSRLATALLLNLAFVVIEVIGGLWTNSIAILTDALHDAGDCFSLGMAWYLEKVSRRGADARFTYGYRRFSSLGALITAVVLMAGLCFAGWHAAHRLFDPAPVKATGMLAIAVAGVLFNGFAAWRLHGGDKQSLNQRVVLWHLLEDTLGWGAVLIGSAIMTVVDAPIIDPLLAIGIAIFILWNVGRNLRQVAMVFLQRAPASFDHQAMQEQLEAIEGVAHAHHTHTWTLDGQSHVFSTHLVMAPDSTRDQIVAAKAAARRLLADQDFDHITIDVELEGEPCAAGMEKNLF